MMKGGNVICPLCGSHRNSLCYEEEAPDVDFTQDKFSTHVERYFICINCGLIYIYPRPSANALQKYYDSIPVSQTSNEVLSNYKRSEYELTVNFVLNNTKLYGGMIVDVGAASGHLLYGFGSRIKSKLIGIEASKEYCDFVANNYKIEMIYGQFEEIALEEYGLIESVDLVLCCHTLEHTIDPAGFLRKLSLIVKPSGFLYIEVPSTQILATFSNARYGRNIHHLHLNHFLSSNLSSACSKYGLSPVIMHDDTGSNYPSLKALFVKQAPAERANKLFLQQVSLLEKQYAQVKERIAAVMNASDKKVALWGAGQDLIYVLRENADILHPDRVILVDRNPHKQGKDFFGHEVQNPELVNWRSIDHVLITPSNQMLQLHIKEDIDRMCPNNVKCSFLFQTMNQI